MSLVLNVEILGEYKKLKAATQGAEQTITKMRDKFVGVAGTIGKVVGGIGLGLGAAVASQIKPAITAASDLQESINAVNVSFGDAAAGILELGESSAKGLGLSKTELFGISVQFSAFAEKIAGDGGDIVKVVDDISTRGADFASVFNLEVSDALAKFQSGLAGEMEPLRKFGIDLSAATVEAYALENGIWDGTGAMTEQEKVLSRYGSLMEQTEKVTGDFANTSDGLANQTRIVKASFEDLKAEVGEKMLPVLEGVTSWILETLIPTLEDLWAEMTDPQGEVSRQLEATEEAWNTFVGTFKFGSDEIKRQDVFAWIGDSIVSVIRNLTHLSVFVQEIFSGMSKIFQAGFSVGPLANALRGAGIAQVTGAMSAANQAASKIQFSNEIYRDKTMNTGSASWGVNDVNIYIEGVNMTGEELIDTINAKLKSQGSTSILR